MISLLPRCPLRINSRDLSWHLLDYRTLAASCSAESAGGSHSKTREHQHHIIFCHALLLCHAQDLVHPEIISKWSALILDYHIFRCKRRLDRVYATRQGPTKTAARPKSFLALLPKFIHHKPHPSLTLFSIPSPPLSPR